MVIAYGWPRATGCRAAHPSGVRWLAGGHCDEEHLARRALDLQRARLGHHEADTVHAGGAVRFAKQFRPIRYYYVATALVSVRACLRLDARVQGVARRPAR